MEPGLIRSASAEEDSFKRRGIKGPSPPPIVVKGLGSPDSLASSSEPSTLGSLAVPDDPHLRVDDPPTAGVPLVRARSSTPPKAPNVKRSSTADPRNGVSFATLLTLVQRKFEALGQPLALFHHGEEEHSSAAAMAQSYLATTRRRVTHEARPQSASAKVGVHRRNMSVDGAYERKKSLLSLGVSGRLCATAVAAAAATAANEKSGAEMSSSPTVIRSGYLASRDSSPAPPSVTSRQASCTRRRSRESKESLEERAWSDDDLELRGGMGLLSRSRRHHKGTKSELDLQALGDQWDTMTSVEHMLSASSDGWATTGLGMGPKRAYSVEKPS